MKKAVFLDRDGIIVEDVPFLSSASQLKLKRDAAEAMKEFQRVGFLIIIVTNQPVVARGLCTEEELRGINAELVRLLEQDAVRVSAVYYCPHHPEQHEDRPAWTKKYSVECECRKPKPGMLLAASREHGIDMRASFFIGNTWRDVAAARVAGCRSILIGNDERAMEEKPDFLCRSITDAALVILGRGTSYLQAVILAGGKATRLHPFTENVPKCLIEVNGKTVLERQIGELRRNNLTNILVLTHHLAEQIEQRCGDGSALGVHLSYCREEGPLGTGGALKNAEKQLRENFIVILGDVLFECDLRELAAFHESRGGCGVFAVRKSEHPLDSDILETGVGGRVKRIYRTKEGEGFENVCLTGIMILNKCILSYCSAGERLDLEKELVAKAVASGEEFFSLELAGKYCDIGTHERLEKARVLFP